MEGETAVSNRAPSCGRTRAERDFAAAACNCLHSGIWFSGVSD